MAGRRLSRLGSRFCEQNRDRGSGRAPEAPTRTSRGRRREPGQPLPILALSQWRMRSSGTKRTRPLWHVLVERRRRRRASRSSPPAAGRHFRSISPAIRRPGPVRTSTSRPIRVKCTAFRSTHRWPLSTRKDARVSSGDPLQLLARVTDVDRPVDAGEPDRHRDGHAVAEGRQDAGRGVGDVVPDLLRRAFTPPGGRRQPQDVPVPRRGPRDPWLRRRAAQERAPAEAAVSKIGQPISVRQAVRSAESRGPTR